MILKIIGVAFILWGIADLIVGLQGGDIWTYVNYRLPDTISEYSPYVAMLIGAVIFALSGGRKTPQRF